MVSFPVDPLIVSVSVPLVNELAVRAAKDAVVPDPTLIMRFDVPAAVSVTVSYTHLTLPTNREV